MTVDEQIKQLKSAKLSQEHKTILSRACKARSSTNRHLAADLLSDIVTMDNIKNSYNKFIHEEFINHWHDNIPKYDEIILFCDPELIGSGVINALYCENQK